MHFERRHLYHVFNQGNNRQKIFFARENYLFFLRKVRTHILPHADILAWCLMPNHFHFMLYIHSVGVTPSHPDTKKTSQLKSHPDTKPYSKERRLNDSIGILLRSYTRAINKQEKRTGSLFREDTKAICLTSSDTNTRLWFKQFGITIMDNLPPEQQYPNLCFNYILNNPIKDKLVRKPEDWEFSGWSDIVGKRKGNLINYYRIKEYGLVLI